MTAVVVTRHLTKRYRRVIALDRVDVRLEEGAIHALLGRNGAGKTTFLRLLAGQSRPSAGTIQVFPSDSSGGAPFENGKVSSRVLLAREGQRYPEAFTGRHVLRAAGFVVPRWDAEYASRLATDFDLPLDRPVTKLSRGQQSALGVIVGLASRAPLTIFDEPHLGLDAASRQLFHDRLLEDYTEHPRTVVLSSHLIDEIARLVEHVLVLDRGRVLIQDDAERLRTRALAVSGPDTAASHLAEGANVLRRDELGGRTRVTMLTGTPDAADALRSRADSLGLDVAPVSLQELVVLLTAQSNDAGGYGAVSGESSPGETGMAVDSKKRSRTARAGSPL